MGLYSSYKKKKTLSLYSNVWPEICETVLSYWQFQEEIFYDKKTNKLLRGNKGVKGGHGRAEGEERRGREKEIDKQKKILSITEQKSWMPLFSLSVLTDK